MSELAKYGYIDVDELGRILNSRPAYVVTEKDANYFKKKPQQSDARDNPRLNVIFFGKRSATSKSIKVFEEGVYPTPPKFAFR